MVIDDGADTDGKPGRRRDQAVTDQILRAALELVDEQGVDALTTEGVAARAGVGKSTIYRRWPNVWAVVMDAFLADLMSVAPIQERKTARESFRISMRTLAQLYRGKTGSLLGPLLGRAQTDEDLREAIQSRWVEPRREIARELVRRGVESGELREGLDPDVVLDTLYGPIYHRMLVPYRGAGLTDEYIDQIVDHVFTGLARNADAASPRRRAKKQ
jgi:AcrR family transcriptional regulator